MRKSWYPAVFGLVFAVTVFFMAFLANILEDAEGKPNYVWVGGVGYRTDLTVLDLSGNEYFRDSDMWFLSHFHDLVELTIYGRDITDLWPLFGLENLEVLRLDYNRISNLRPLSNFENLRVLSLAGNQIADEYVKAKTKKYFVKIDTFFCLST